MVDTVASYAGLRTYTVGAVDGVIRPLLNGKFVYQIATLDQGFWPDGNCKLTLSRFVALPSRWTDPKRVTIADAAPTDAALRSDLEAHKTLGFVK